MLFTSICPGKVPGPDSICPELILHAGAALKSWLRDFLSSCLFWLHDSKFPRSGEELLWSRSQNQESPGGPKELSTDISALCPLQDPRETYLRPR